MVEVVNAVTLFAGAVRFLSQEAEGAAFAAGVKVAPTDAVASVFGARISRGKIGLGQVRKEMV